MNPLVALVLGIISAFAFQPFGLWVLMPMAFAALCEMIARAPTLRRSLLLGWLFGLGQFAVGLNWIATAFTFQAAMPAWLGWVAVVALSFYLAVYPMLAVGLAWRFGRDRPIALVLALAGGWAITEWLRATMFTGFAWNPVGVAFVDSQLLGASRWLGTYGLSILMVLSSGALWLAWRRNFKSAAWVAVSIVALALVPAPALQPNREPGPSIRIVQPNIGQEDKWREGLTDEAFVQLGRLSADGPDQRSSPPRLLFWPEAALNDAYEIDYDSRLRADLATLLGPRDLLVTGGTRVEYERRRRSAGIEEIEREQLHGAVSEPGTRVVERLGDGDGCAPGLRQ